MKKIIKLSLILMVISSCNNAAKDTRSSSLNIPSNTKDSVLNSSLEKKYILDHMDDPQKRNIVIAGFADLLDQSFTMPLSATIADEAGYDSVECFLTEDFIRSYMAVKWMTSYLKPDDELKFLGVDDQYIPMVNQAYPLKDIGMAMEYAPVKKYKLSDSVYAFSFSEFTLPSKMMSQYFTETRLLIYDHNEQYLGGFEAYSDYTHSMSGYGYKTSTELLKDGGIKITFIDYSPDNNNNTVTTEIISVFKVVKNEIERISYTKNIVSPK
jgi:hypothetical protein